MAILAGSGLTDVAGLDGLAKLMGRERCVGGRNWVVCQDWKLEYTSCCQNCQYWVDCQDWIAKFAKTGTLGDFSEIPELVNT